MLDFDFRSSALHNMSLHKQRHHYVPQFWIRRFRGAGNTLYQWDGVRCKKVSPEDILQESWLNTTFDSQWQASNDIEDRLSKLESIAARLFQQLEDSSIILVEGHRQVLCEFLALQACRHPDILNSGHRKAHKLAELAGDVPLFDTEGAFVRRASELGVSAQDASTIYNLLRDLDPDELATEAAKILDMSPHDPKLPQIDALRAMEPIATALKKLSYELVSAPLGQDFVLGDTPLPQDHLGDGFTVPISKSLAIIASQSNGTPSIFRRTATAMELAESNRRQWEMAAQLVVGPDSAQLSVLGPR